MTDARRPYVVILAGGEGNRLAPLTRALYGMDLPKQFAVLAGQHSLMQTTIERAALLTTLDRISVVVSAHHEEIARQQLAPYDGVELVVQPKNLDTAPGMLLPLVRILARDGDARVVFLPSDHYIANIEPLHAALDDAARNALCDRVTLIGVAPTGPEVEYGWIVRGAPIRRSHGFEVARFQEKPSTEIAEELWVRGGVWNTFIQTGPAHAFWALARRCLPHHAEALERYAVAIGSYEEAVMLARAYRTMPAANFSRDVLAHAESLAVVPVSGSGWSDWGSPARVFASLAGTENHDHLVGRIQGDLRSA
jgi:mannose-1-phosphate guanylyltransferase